MISLGRKPAAWAVGVCLLLLLPRTASAGLRETKLTANDGKPGDEFGASVAMSGNTIVLGANRVGENGTIAAYVFVREGPSWVQQAKLTPADSEPVFGNAISVAISGDLVVLGVPGAAVYSFARSGTEWVQTAKLTTAGPLQGAGDFGHSVAILGNTALVGAPRAFNPETSLFSGAFYQFGVPDFGGVPFTDFGVPVFPDDGKADDVFGLSVAIGRFFPVVIGAAEHRDDGFGQGAVYLLGEGKLHSDVGGLFGEQVAVSENTLLVASTGAAEVFVRDAGLPQMQAKLAAAEGFANAFLQVNVIALSGDTAAVVGRKGGIFLYTRSGTTWTPENPEQPALKASDGSLFSTVAIDGNTVVGGAPAFFAAVPVPGAAYVYEPQPDLDTLRDLISGLPEGVFKAKGTRTAMLSILDEVAALIDSGDVTDAAGKLRNLRRHVDGCPPAPDINDWLLTCEAQIEVRALLDALIASLGGDAAGTASQIAEWRQASSQF